MKILVTGGAGYIGSVLVPMLLDDYGHEVTVIDSFMYNQTSLLDVCWNSKFNVIRADVTNEDFMIPFYENNKFDVIIPLACLTGAPLCGFNPRTAYEVIVNAIKLMCFYVPPETKIIYPTTNSGYGIGTEEMCTEETPLKPISHYGIYKCTAESIIQDRGNYISLRLATAFGVSPRMRTDLLVNNFVQQAVNNKVITLFEGNFRRNFIHVHDICTAIVKGIVSWEDMKNQAYNVGLSSANLTKLELANLVAKKTGASVVIAENQKDPDKRDYLVSNAKLEATKWVPFYTLEDGIDELIKAYKIIKENKYSNI